MKIKVLIIDDSAVVRETMTQILSSDPEIHVMGTCVCHQKDSGRTA